MIKATRHVYYAEEVDPAEAVGWYYSYTLESADPMANTMTEEQGPFALRATALAHAKATQPPDWDVTERRPEMNEQGITGRGVSASDQLPGATNPWQYGVRLQRQRSCFEVYDLPSGRVIWRYGFTVAANQNAACTLARRHCSALNLGKLSPDAATWQEVGDALGGDR